MDWLTFIAAIVKAIAWPIVVLAIIFIVRDRLGGVVSRLIEVTFPGGSVKFAERLDRSETLSERVALEGASRNRQTIEGLYRSDESNDLRNLSETHPEAAVLESFKFVEAAILGAAIAFDLDVTKGNFSALVAEMQKRELVTSEVVELYTELRGLRNTAAHARRGDRITPQSARLFRDQCRVLAGAFRNLAKNSPKE